MHDASLVHRPCDPCTSSRISSRFQLLSRLQRQVAHALLTRPPLSFSDASRRINPMAPFDLNVLGTPPAFILSQDQTLYYLYYIVALCYAYNQELFRSAYFLLCKVYFLIFFLKEFSRTCLSLCCSIFNVRSALLAPSRFARSLKRLS